MSIKRSYSEADSLEIYRLTMDNAVDHPDIAEILAKLGYDAESLKEGKLLLEEAKSIQKASKNDKDELSKVYRVFSAKCSGIDEAYLLHRQLGRVVFRLDKPTIDKLSIKGKVPSNYVKWIGAVKSFYNGAVENPAIQEKLARYNITIEELNATLEKIKEVEKTRSEYMKRKAISQNATQIKAATFENTFNWMRDFYAVARIALKKQPQLLEAFGKVVKS